MFYLFIKTLKNLFILFGLICSINSCKINSPEIKPNILFVMADDHTSQAWGIYNGILDDYVKNDAIKYLADNGTILNNMFCTNSICVPSRASILTGQYSHQNGVYTLGDHLSPDSLNVAKILNKNGYETALVGKWHLKKEPSGFDYYKVLPGQGKYNNPVFKIKENWEDGYKGGVKEAGFSSDVIGSSTIKWLKERKSEKPFFLMTHFKATHEPFDYPERHNDFLKNIDLPEPESLYDFAPSSSGRSFSGQQLEILTNRWINYSKNKDHSSDTKYPGMPFTVEGMSEREIRSYSYQKFVKDFLRCAASIDDNLQKIIDYLKESNQIQNTIIVYTSDQGYFLGEHGFFDKRMMYEESSRMPFVISYPERILKSQRIDDMILNLDIPSLFLDYAGIKPPKSFQGKSFRKSLESNKNYKGREFTYYRYWEHSPVRPAHLGIRSKKNKLIYFYGEGLGKKNASYVKSATAWEYYDLIKDPLELKNEFYNPDYKNEILKLHQELIKEKQLAGDKETLIPNINEV
ncbi:sulfatase-like hydrolase/transferase [Flavobacteriaceae bacterium]|nr:sulfatase-like hydrolase/transferase [Flavobacteriaceae bacterium]